jgi:hypothetical protein
MSAQMLIMRFSPVRAINDQHPAAVEPSMPDDN